MRIVRARESFNLPDVQHLLRNRSVGVTIGNFDAFHLGHQSLFSTLDRELTKRATDTAPPIRVLMTFWPHPREVLRRLRGEPVTRGADEPDSGFVPLCSFRERVHLSARFGFELMYAAHFTRRFAELSPEEFLRLHLFEPFHPSVIVVGDDWGFGKGRAGGIELLAGEAARRGAVAEIVPAQSIALRSGKTERVRTSAIKHALRVGDLETVTAMLGRRHAIEGQVRHGDHRGRQIGFPTANVSIGSRVLPPLGVYAVWAIYGGVRWPAVANLGYRPTFGGMHPRLEVHLLEGNHELYGVHLTVEFVAYLREERRFGSVDELRAAIRADCVAARSFVSPS